MMEILKYLHNPPGAGSAIYPWNSKKLFQEKCSLLAPS
jgi:hypothetical protein